MNFLSRLLALAALSLISACTTPPQIDYFGKAKEAISQGKWMQAYLMLERPLASSDRQDIATAMRIALEQPEVLKAADSNFEVVSLHAYMVERGKNTGRDLSLIRLQSYRHIATSEGLAKAQRNISVAHETFFSAEDLARKERERVQAVGVEVRLAKEKKEAAERRKELLAAAAIRVLRVNASAERARFTCRDSFECNKAFALTQIFISENSNMKIQTANDTIIETFNPSDLGSIGMKAMKFPRSGSANEIIITISCKTETKVESIEEESENLCANFKVSLYEQFVPFVQRNLKN
jgi:hypothetical protein